MKFFAKPTDIVKVEADMVVAFAKAAGTDGGGFVLSDEAKKIDQALGGMLTEVATAEGFEAKQGNSMLIHTQGRIAAKRVLLLGLGNLKDLTMHDWQMITATVARKAKAASLKRVAVALSQEILDTLNIQSVAQGLVEGMTLGTYVFNRHKSKAREKKDNTIEEVYVLIAAGKLDAVAQGLTTGETVAQAGCFARDLVNEPPSLTTPTYLSRQALAIAKASPLVSCEVLDKSDMEKLGMGGILGIARGSDEEPKFIKLSYAGGGRKTVALVGKGITFDSGGLSLKPSEGMETMKIDMAGAAAILGVFQALTVLKPKVNVVGLICATENMPSGGAIKPGDVVTAMNGKTIEILNTDAEGRVVLADGLSYAVEKVKPDVMVDLATLTGACMVALGEEISGLFANDAKLAQSLKEAAEQSGEKIWELPLAKEYKELLKSSVADIKNISGKRYGGAINGALFLQEFVPDNIPWAHLDIAGPAWAEKDTPLEPRGATGVGVRMMLCWLNAQ